MDDFITVFCTCPNEKVADDIGTQVISNSLAGCVNILPNVTSIYRWQGKIEKEKEYLLVLKTTKNCYPSLEKLIIKLHPYQVPEIIALSINYASLEYLEWLKQNIS